MFERVIVTGGTGFFGSHIYRALLASGQAKEVFALGSREYDLRDESAVTRMFVDVKPDAVIHAAGHVGGIAANRAKPADFLYDNLKMGSLVIHHAHLHHIKKLILIGTVCSYPKFTTVPFREADFWSGYPEETNAPYGIAKRAIFAQAEAYRQQYQLPVSCLLPSNLYGPGDSIDTVKSHVIPALISKFSIAKESRAPSVTLWGDGTPTRDFLFVEDAAQAVVSALNNNTFVGPCNIGTGIETSIVALAKLIAEELQYTGEIRWNAAEPNGQPRRCLEVTRAQELLGFRYQTSLVEGVRKTIDWYQRSHVQ